MSESQESHPTGPVLIIDGLNFFIRHFCANPTLSENGEHVGGFFGFMKGIGSLCETFSPSRIIVVWESGGNIRKRKMFNGYKSGRRAPGLNRYYEDDLPTTKENHAMQISLLTKAMQLLPITQMYVKDTEADDVIGYISRYVFESTPVILVSSDKDFYQLISPTLQQWSPGQKKLIDSAKVIEKFGVSPENFVSARVFIGDPSDSIEGLKGVGFKKMAKLFPELKSTTFISYNEIIDQAKSLLTEKSNKMIQDISESSAIAKLNWKLMNLDVSQLSGDQVKKIHYQLEQSGSSHKMNLLRLFHTNGMAKLDINRLFMAINRVGKNEY